MSEDLRKRIDDHEEGLMIHKSSLMNLIKRIKTIEDFIGQNYATDINKINERISIVEKYCDKDLADWSELDDKIINALDRIDSLENVYNKWLLHDVNQVINRKPHKCPVCSGQGCYDVENLSSSLRVNLECHCCEGKGILWG